MSIPENLDAQTDFSGGQINASAKRRDDLDPVKTGGLQMGNFRAEAQGSALSRPGRAAVYAGAARTQVCRMDGNHSYHINFYSGQVQITDTLGNIIATNTSASYLWTGDAASVALISVAQAVYQVVICFPGMQPQLCIWNPNTTVWTFAPFSWSVIGNNSQEPFYRANAFGATMSWSAASANYATAGASITLTCSMPYFVSAMIGARLSILGGQVTITGVTSSTVATVTVNSRLPDSVVFSGVNITIFSPGQVAASTNSGNKFEVISASSGNVTGVLISSNNLVLVNNAVADTVSSPEGSSATSGFTLYSGTAAQTVQWQEQFMSAYNGWPSACFYGNNRLGFCQWPQRQEAILWLALGQPSVGYIDAGAAWINQAAGVSATSAILEYITKGGRPKVLNVVDIGDEFVFTDRGVYFIPISGTNPLKPGSVEFRLITNDGCSPTRPIALLQSVIYANAAGNRMSIIRATGAYTLPYSSDDISDVHSDLFSNPTCIAVSAGDAAPERLCYVVNSNGTLVVGKFSRQGGFVGWHPEPSVGVVSWIQTDLQSVFFNVKYAGGIVMELETVGLYLDCQLSVNLPTPNMVVGGKGPFWWLPGSIVTLALNGADLGDFTIDANGNIVVPQGVVVSDPALIGGCAVSKTFQPIVKMAQPGQSGGQRQRRRSIKAAMITVQANCDYTWGSRTIPAVNFGDDATVAPPMREQSEKTKPQGRAYYPSIVFTSARYGQIRLMECSLKVSV